MFQRDTEVRPALDDSRQTWHGDWVRPIFARHDWGIGVERKILRHQADVRIDRRVPGEFLTRVSTHPAQDRRHRTVGTVVGFVVFQALADRGCQVVVFDLVRILVVSFEPIGRTSERHHLTTGVGIPFGPVNELADAVPRVRDVAALAVHAAAVFVLELDIVMVVDLTIFLIVRTWRPPMPFAFTGWPCFTQFPTSRLWMCCSQM
jgi:hypothetical protein